MEELPGGLLLKPQGPMKKKRICLLDQRGEERIHLEIGPRLRRKQVKISLDYRPFAEIRPRKRKKGSPVEFLSSRAKLEVARSSGGADLEFRRNRVPGSCNKSSAEELLVA